MTIYPGLGTREKIHPWLLDKKGQRVGQDDNNLPGDERMDPWLLDKKEQKVGDEDNNLPGSEREDTRCGEKKDQERSYKESEKV